MRIILWLGVSPQHKELYWKVAALGRLRADDLIHPVCINKSTLVHDLKYKIYEPEHFASFLVMKGIMWLIFKNTETSQVLKFLPHSLFLGK